MRFEIIRVAAVNSSTFETLCSFPKAITTFNTNIMMAQVPLADTTNLHEPHCLNTEPQGINFKHPIPHLNACDSNLGTLKEKDTSAQTNIRIMSSGRCTFTLGTMSCNCVQGRYTTYPGSGKLNEKCQICLHPSSAHKDAFKTTGNTPSLNIWIEDLTNSGDILSPKENQAAVALVSPRKIVQRFLFYAC